MSLDALGTLMLLGAGMVAIGGALRTLAGGSRLFGNPMGWAWALAVVLASSGIAAVRADGEVSAADLRQALSGMPGLTARGAAQFVSAAGAGQAVHVTLSAHTAGPVQGVEASALRH